MSHSVRNWTNHINQTHFQEKEANPEELGNEVMLVRQDLQDHKVRKVPEEKMVFLAPLEIQEREAHLVHLGHLALLDLLERRVTRDLKANKDGVVKLDCLVRKDSLELQESQAVMVHRDPKGREVQQDLLDPQGQLDLLDHLDHLVHQDLAVQRV